MLFDKELLSVEFVKLKDGMHQFQYQLDKAFFELFGNTEVLKADLNVQVDMEKSVNMLQVRLNSTGFIFETCDRCLTDLGLPVEAEFKIFYHLNVEEVKEDGVEDLYTEVVYLKPSDYKINLAQSIYESVLISLPMIKNCDDLDEDDKPCNFEMLDKLEQMNHGDTQNESVDPRWNKLKELFKKEE